MITEYERDLSIIAYNYLGMDFERIWEIATRDVTKLKLFCRNMLK